MNPVKFKEQTAMLAKDQPEYRPLPVFISIPDGNGVRQYTGKYELSDLELQQIVATKSIFFSQYGNCFHPIFPTIENQFVSCQVYYEKMPTGVYDFYINMQDGSTLVIADVPLENAIGAILHRVTNIKAEHIQFIERLTSGIDENGNIVQL